MEKKYSGESISQVLMNFPGFNGTESFISVFTKLATKADECSQCFISLFL
jgi:hypothetical protein